MARILFRMHLYKYRPHIHKHTYIKCFGSVSGYISNKKIGFLSRRFRSLPANMYVYITYYMHAVNASNILFIFEFHSLSFPVHVWKRLLGARKIKNPPKYPIFSSCDRFCCSYLSFTLLSCDTLLLRPYDSSHTNQMFNYEHHLFVWFSICYIVVVHSKYGNLEMHPKLI